MPDRVLPTLFVLLIVGEVLHNIFVYAVESQSFFRAAADSHHDECIVTVGGLLVFLFVGERGAAGRRRLRARHVQLSVGGRGRARGRLGQQVADGETVWRSHRGATSRAAGTRLPRRAPAAPAPPLGTSYRRPSYIHTCMASYIHSHHAP